MINNTTINTIIIIVPLRELALRMFPASTEINAHASLVDMCANSYWSSSLMGE